MSKCTCSAHGGFLTAKGLQEAAERGVDSSGVDAMGLPRYLDSRVSVSGLELERDIHVSDELLDEQFRRNFLQEVL